METWCLNERDTNQAIDRAYARLSVEERSVVDFLVTELMNGAKKRRKETIYFGRKEALEVLAKLGIWMNRK